MCLVENNVLLVEVWTAVLRSSWKKFTALHAF